MILSRTIKYGILALMVLSSLLLLGCGGCALQEDKDLKISPLDISPIAILPQEEEFTSNAKSIFAYLLFDQALRQADKDTVLMALQELSKHNPPASVYMDASGFFLDENPTDVLPILERAIATHNEEIPLHLLYTEVLQKAQQGPLAIAHMREIVQRYPHDVEAQLGLALLLVNDEEHTEAEQILTNIPPKKRTPLVNYYHARALISMKRFDEALGFLQKTLDEAPYFIEALADAARIYEMKGDLLTARDYYEKLLYETGNNPDTALRIIYLSLRLKELEQALEYFEIMPQNPNFNTAVASMLVEEQHYDEAENILQELLNLPNPPQELYFYLAAIAYERDRNPQNALAYVDNITDDNINYGRVLRLRLQLLIEMQRLTEALAVARLGQRALPKEHAAQNDFITTEIRLLAALDRLPEAIAKNEALVKTVPDFQDAMFLLATLFDQNQEKEKALAVMEEIIKKNPQHFQALNYIGYTLAEENRDLMRAVTLLRKAVSLSPQSDYILDSLAWALFKSGNTQEAWKIINQAIAINATPDPAIWEHYADIARTLGHTQEARKGYEKALTFNPLNADSLKQRLADL